jgi:ABC-type branched-subunit amino acid transport system substrate-binding protein
MRFPTLLIACGLAIQTTSPVQRGKQIYVSGTGQPSSPIVATLGDDSDQVSASLLPCANCHGDDGRGKTEAGITPPDIRWETLTRPYQRARPGGRTAPPYTERTLIRAITMGIDPAGNRLNRAMPRYRLSQADAADLIAYLKDVGAEPEPGVTANAIGIGVILPPSTTMPEANSAVARVLTAYFKELNDAGGIYNRRIDVSFADASRPGAIAQFRSAPPFAMAASFLAGAEGDVSRLVSDTGVPLVGAFTLDPRADPASRVFYADAGLPGQAESLATFAAKRRPGGHVVVVYSAEPVSRRAADAVMSAGQLAGWTGELVRIASVDDERWRSRLRTADGVFFVSLDGSAFEFLRVAAASAPRADFFVPGPLTAKDIFQLPSSLDGRVFVSFAALPSDRTAPALAEYHRLATAHGLTREAFAEQIATLSAARLLTEALQRAGHELTRQKLVAAMESLRQFSTGLTPPITYTPTRRIGVTGAHIVTLDLKSGAGVPRSVWVEAK